MRPVPAALLVWTPHSLSGGYSTALRDTPPRLGATEGHMWVLDYSRKRIVFNRTRCSIEQRWLVTSQNGDRTPNISRYYNVKSF